MDSLEIFRLILNVFELAAAIAGFVYWWKIKNSYWRWFPLLLAFIFITEITAKVMRWEGTYKTWVPLLYKYINIPVMFIVLLWLMGKEFSNARWRHVSLILIGLYFVILITEEMLFKDIFSRFGTLSYQSGCVAILIMAFLSFFKLTRSAEILLFKQSMHFWVSLGVVLYLVTTLPFMAFRNSLFKYNYDIGLQLWYITMIFNFLMYSCFIAGFMLYKPRLQSLQTGN